MADYLCHKTEGNILIDGDLSKKAWQNADLSLRFIDVIDGAPALYDTRAALKWNDDYLYIGFWCEEPYPRAHITKRDSPLWLENAVEIMIDGGDTYYELQVNAINNIYEALYIWQDAYRRDPRYIAEPAFDVYQNDATVFGGNHDRNDECFWRGSHPRGKRWAFLNWDFPGLQTVVKIDGELNNDMTASRGFNVELALAWDGMKWLAGGRPLPPRIGDIWRIFLGRCEKLRIGGKEVSAFWAWDKIGTNDNHCPEKFTRIEFAE